MRMNKRALKRTAIDAGITGLAGLAYYAFIRITGLSIPCYIHKLTGLLCPSCGITRMFLYLAGFDLKSAFEANQLLFFMWPFAAGMVFYVLYKFHAKEELPKLSYVLMFIMIGISVVFGIIRNV